MRKPGLYRHWKNLTFSKKQNKDFTFVIMGIVPNCKLRLMPGFLIQGHNLEDRVVSKLTISSLVLGRAVAGLSHCQN